MLIIFALAALGFYIQGCYQAKIYNQIHHTTYTCPDFFWAADQINSQSQTINLNQTHD